MTGGDSGSLGRQLTLELWRDELDAYREQWDGRDGRFTRSRQEITDEVIRRAGGQESFYTLDDLALLIRISEQIEEDAHQVDVAAGRILTEAMKVCTAEELAGETAWSVASARRLIKLAADVPRSWMMPSLAVEALAGLEKANPLIRAKELVQVLRYLDSLSRIVEGVVRRLVWELNAAAGVAAVDVAAAAARSTMWVRKHVNTVRTSLLGDDERDLLVATRLERRRAGLSR